MQIEQDSSDFNLQFDGHREEPTWSAQNDDVMGGVSTGRSELREGALLFTGSLSRKNNGGFAQVRIRNLDLDLSGSEGMKMRVLGDGRIYEFRLATDARYRGSRIAYSVAFETHPGEWIEVDLPFSKLKPSHHGRTLEGPPANLSQVEEISLLIADGEEGPFSLQVDWMKAG